MKIYFLHLSGKFICCNFTGALWGYFLFDKGKRLHLVSDSGVLEMILYILKVVVQLMVKQNVPHLEVA